MTNHMIKVLPDGRHQVYSVLMGHYTLPVGPKWETPRQAVDYANALDGAPTTSPLRSSVDGSTPVSRPSVGPGQSEPSTESPRGRLRASRTARG